MKTVSIVDYGVGNLRSVVNAIESIGCRAVVVSDVPSLQASEKILLPGVGSYRVAMEQLTASGLTNALLECVLEYDVPLLGICVGMQLLADSGTEDGGAKGLGLIPGIIDKFDVKVMQTGGKKIPHVGFNSIHSNLDSRLLQGLGSNIDVYFTHSYRLAATKDDCIAATCDYGENFFAAVEKNNVAGTQFHPEKSQANGLAILRNFVENF